MTVTAFFEEEPEAQQTVKFTPKGLWSTMAHAFLSRFEVRRRYGALKSSWADHHG